MAGAEALYVPRTERILHLFLPKIHFLMQFRNREWMLYRSAKFPIFFAERESLAEKKSALDKEVYRLDTQKEKLEESIESQINYMWDEYEITLSDAAKIRDESMTDMSSMKKEISSFFYLNKL